MDTNNNIQKAKNVPPFVRYCSAIIPTMFDDSLSYYEALCALWKWMQTNLVDVINNNANVTEYYIQIVKDLKSYVENYFENLDVQEEINNKLDQMAEDGTLQEIIGSYLDSNVTWTFDTVADMKSSINLYEGSYARTLGYYAIGDGGGALYNITSSGTANDCDVIAINSGVYANYVYEGSLNIKQFGAKGDGTTDDTSVILRALAYRGNNDTNITFNSNETYIVGGQLYIYSNTNIDLCGATLKDVESPLDPSPGKNDMQFMNNTESIEIAGYGALKNFNIKNGTLDGNNGGVMFCLLHASDCTFENLIFNDAFYYTHVFDMGGCNGITIKNCKFIGNKIASAESSYREVIQLDYAGYNHLPYWGDSPSIAFDNLPTINVTVDGCYFAKKADDTYFLNAVGTHSTNSTGGAIKNITVSNCEFHDSEYASVRFLNVDNLNVLNNIFFDESSSERQGHCEIQIEKASDGIYISGNEIKIGDGNGGLGFTSIKGESNDRAKNVEITNNIFTGQYNDGGASDYGDFIRIGNTNNVLISGNVCTKAKNFIYVIYDAQNINSLVVSNNNLNYCFKYIRSNMPYADSGDMHLSQSGNIWTDSRGTIAFNSFKCKVYISSDIPSPAADQGSFTVKFTDTDNPFVTVNNNGQIILPDFVLDFAYQPNIAFYTTGNTNGSRWMQSFVGGSGSENGLTTSVVAGNTEYNVSAPVIEYRARKFSEYERTINIRTGFNTTDVLKAGNSDYRKTVVMIEGR